MFLLQNKTDILSRMLMQDNSWRNPLCGPPTPPDVALESNCLVASSQLLCFQTFFGQS